MDELPPKVRERLTQLSKRFRDGLPEVFSDLTDLRSRGADGDVDALRELRMRVHRIAGSASTFGLTALTDAARCAEDCVERDLAADVQVLSDVSVRALDQMQTAADRSEYEESSAGGQGDGDRPSDGVGRNADESASLVRRVDDDGVPVMSGNGPTRRRVVIMVGTVPGLGPHFPDQLAVFGMSLIRIDDMDELSSYVDAGTPTEGDATGGEGTTKNAATLGGVAGAAVERGYTVVLAAVAFLAEDARRLKVLSDVRSRHPHRLLTILVGEEDDFETRLRSVRYRADAFLSLPVDSTQLVDRLESLVGLRERDPYHVLIVDDDPEQVSSTALMLQQAGMITSVVTDPRNIFRVLVEYKPELILMDMYMPDCTGAELAAIIRQNDSFVGIPIVFLSVETDAERQLGAIRSGADDFLVKPIDPDHLVTSVRIRAARTRSMRFFMERDSLTGLLNHTNLKQRLDDDLSRARRIGTEMVFAMIDIDHFKSVNDTYGHLTGDRVLKGLARLLSERLRRTDVVGRYGGEEFGVILFNTTEADARRLMDDLRERFSRLRQSNGEQEFTVTFSCGIAAYPGFDTAGGLSEAADAALYRAKEAGRNRVRSASDVE